MERLTPLKKLSGKLIGRIYTLLVVLIGFTLFRADTVGQGLTVIGRLFTGFSFTRDGTILFRELITVKLILALAVGIPVSLGLHRLLADRWKQKPVLRALSYAGALCLFALCILRLAAASFNPFIYFQF